VQKVYFTGRLAEGNRAEAAEIVRKNGGRTVKKLTADVDLIVVGDEDILKQDWNLWNDQLDAATQESFEKGTLTILAENEFWKKYGGGDQPQPSHPMDYTPSMLAGLTGLPPDIIRRLHREGFIIPVRQVRRLCYFGRESLLLLKLFQNMTAAGLSVPAAAARLQKIKQHHTGKNLLSGMQVDGKYILFVTKNGIEDHNGQLRFSFGDAAEPVPCRPAADTLSVLDSVFEPQTETNDPVRLCEAACGFEAAGQLPEAASLYRAALAAGGGNPQINFQLAEVLYRMGDLSAARERYFSAIELDENFVEARANLGCVLAELGEDEFAAAAFRGALKLHPEYAEVRLHLGKLLKRQGLHEEAAEQFRIFQELMPECKNLIPET
jgi:tetratricopeptide (TPR) repeat protein